MEKKEIKVKLNIPNEAFRIAENLGKAGFSAYLVGGCVRDALLKRKAKDWDIATSAKPEEIQAIFPDSVYENDFGTVAIKTESTDPSLRVIEITTFRVDGEYLDFRHPKEVKFASSIEDDLKRRDFTVNAMALDLSSAKEQKIIDPFSGADDLKNKLVRAVGDPNERFKEDALRLMRAIRFAAELDFQIEEITGQAILANAELIKEIAMERVRDEFQKIIMSERPDYGINELYHFGLLQFIVPEIAEGAGVSQNKHHIYSVFEHNVRALKYTAEKGFSLDIRLAALFHDVGKPRVKSGEGENSTFYNHEVVGAKMTRRIMESLRFPKDLTDRVTHLVRHHLFYYNVGEVTEAGVRRFLRRIGPENVDDFIKVREADRIGSGVPKAAPYKLRHLRFMIEKVKRDPVSPKMLSVNGNELMDTLKIPPSPRVGAVLAILLEEVLDDPKKNTKEALMRRAEKLNALSETELMKIAASARDKKEEFESGQEEEIKKQFFVK